MAGIIGRVLPAREIGQAGVPDTGHFEDDEIFYFGTDNGAGIVRESADANAKCMLFFQPEGGAVNVPVYAFADVSAKGTDLGLFDEITGPTIAVLDATAAYYASLDHDGTDTHIRSNTGFIEFNAGSNNIRLLDDNGFVFGCGNDCTLIFETADANANALVLALPESTGTNAPVLAIGNKTAPSIVNADLGFFDGLNSPILALISTTNTRYCAFLHDGTDMQILVNSGRIKLSCAVMQRKAGDIASANDITLSDGGNFWDITGTTQINTIAATGWIAGSVICFQFDGNVVVKHATAGSGAQLQLAATGDFSATAGDTLMLIYDGTYWREVSRTTI